MNLPRRRLLAVALLAAALAAGTGATPASAATATLTSPVPSTTYAAGSVPIAYALSAPPRNTIRLDFTYTAGSAASVGNTWTVLLVGTSATKSFSMPLPSPLADATDIASVTPSAGASGTSLPDGTYNVTLRYEASAAPTTTVSSLTRTGVTLDATTLAPTLTSPTSAAVVTSPISMSYTLPEGVLSNSVKLTFSSASVTRVVTLGSSGSTVGSHTFGLNPANLLSALEVASVVGGGTSLPDDVYSVTLGYQDAFGHALAVAQATGVTVDTATQAPQLTSPATGEYAATVVVTYVLPEAGLSGSATLTLNGPVSRSVVLADVSAGTHNVSVSRDGLPDGTYTATLSYRDAAGNPLVSTTRAGIVLVTASSQTPTSTTTPLLAPRVATLRAAWSATRKVAGKRKLRAVFKPLAGAKSYRLTATRGRVKRTGVCRKRGSGVRARVICAVAVSHAGQWQLRAAARSSAGRDVAVGTRRLRVVL